MIDPPAGDRPAPGVIGEGGRAGSDAAARPTRLVIVVAALLAVAAILPIHSQHPLRTTAATGLGVAVAMAVVLWRYGRHPDPSQGVLEGALRLAAWSTLVIASVVVVITALGALLTS